MCSEEKICLTAGQSTRFLDIYQNGRNYRAAGGRKRSAPKGAPETNMNRTTREAIGQKARELARYALAILVLCVSMIADVDWSWFGI